MNRRMAWAVVLVWWWGAVAPGGMVQTKDGRTHEGDVTLAAPGHVAVRGVKVPLEQVKRAVVQPSTRPVAWTSDSPSAKATSAGSLPAGWSSQDIGRVKEKGAARFDPQAGAFIVEGSGWGVWGYNDALHFAHMKLEGDGQIIARVSRMDNPAGSPLAYLNLRASVNDDAQQVSIAILPSYIRFTSRPIPTHNHGWGQEIKRPDELWLRLTRREKMFVGYQSTDGRYWRRVDQREFEAPQALLAGAGASAFVNIGLATATFDQVIVAPGRPYETFFLGDENPPQGVILTSGSKLYGQVWSAREERLVLREQPLMEQISPAPQPAEPGQAPPAHEPSIPLERVAWAVFHPLPPDRGQIVGNHTGGVLLADGQLFPGEVLDLRVQNNILRANSLLLGPKDFQIQPNVLGAMYRPVADSGHAYEVWLSDGSILCVRSIEIQPDGIVVDEPAVGKLTIAMDQVMEIRGR